MTRAQELGITEFPYTEINEKGQLCYWEDATGWWIATEWHLTLPATISKVSDAKGLVTTMEYDSNGKRVYESSHIGETFGTRPTLNN